LKLAEKYLRLSFAARSWLITLTLKVINAMVVLTGVGFYRPGRGFGKALREGGGENEKMEAWV